GTEWISNGVVKIAPKITQTIGESTSEVMSQKATTDAIDIAEAPFKPVEVNSHFTRLRKAIKKIELSGNFYGKILTISIVDYDSVTKRFLLVIANPDTEESVIDSSSSKIVCRVSSILETF